MLRLFLLGSTVLISSTLASTVLAQTAPPPASATEVIVTGSRIARSNLEQPTPVSVLSPQVIQNAGTPNLGDILTQLPALGFDGTLRSNSNNFGNSAGISLADLRNLGASRTLVLVDGLRHVAGDIGSNAVDLNSIPTALVDHVEVITGGASAQYGSDAVSGVINIILKKRFEGIEAGAQAGSYDSYGEKYSAYATIGHSYLQDKLNVAISGFYSKENGIRASDLRNAHNYGAITNPADINPATGNAGPGWYYDTGSAITNDGKPDTIYVPNVGSDYVTRNGTLIDINSFLPIYSFDKNGKLIPVPQRSGYNSFAFGQLPANCQDCYFPETYTQLASPFESKGADFRARYDFNPHFSAHLDAKFVQTDTVNAVQPSFSFAAVQLQPDNAFIQPDLRAALAGTAAGDYPLIGKFLNDDRTQTIRRRTYRLVAGLEGDFDVKIAKISWDGALNYGRTESHFVNKSLEITGNFSAALDSVIDPRTGKPACRINVPSAQGAGYTAPDVTNAASCSPYNPFGINQTPGAMAYSFGAFATDDTLTQENAVLNGRTDTSRFFNMQGGPLSIAFGGEYRMERTHETNDAFLLAGKTENLASNSAGGFNVYEGYIEGSAPIFKHAGFLLDELSFDAAYRGAKYSYKQVDYADAYKFGGVYGPIPDIKFRGTYSRAIRAPNITEAFLPPSSGFFNVTDPCDVNNIVTNSAYPANCSAAGIPTGFHANTNASIVGQTSGNPNLQPEKSISYTGGVVLQPRFIPHLSITADYYAIKIKNAITQVAAQDIINNCYSNSGGLNAQYCSLFTRGADHNINFVSTTYVNAAKLETQGVDVQANYFTAVAPLTSRYSMTRWLTGRLSFDLNVNYTLQLHRFPFASNPNQVQILEGTANYPHLKALADISYRQGPAQVTWTTRYVGKSAVFNRNPGQTDYSESSNAPFAGQRIYHSIAVQYDLGGRFSGAQVYGGVNDIFDELPPFQVIGVGTDLAYDLGRYAFIGIKFKR
jgi:iron complex outermembrane receptor protein